MGAGCSWEKEQNLNIIPEVFGPSLELLKIKENWMGCRTLSSLVLLM